MDAADARGSIARSDRRAIVLLRVALGAMFVWVFFENLGKGAYTPAGYRGVIESYLKNGSAPAAWKSVMSFVADHAAIAGPLQAIAEISFGVSLVTGTASRLFAAGAAAFLFSLWVSELGAAWIWELAIPTVVAIALVVTRPGRTWGVDALLARRFGPSPIW